MNNKYLVFISIGFELVGIILASIYLGQQIDNHYQSKGIGIAVMMLLGLAGWLTHVIVLARRFQEKDDDKQGPE